MALTSVGLDRLLSVLNTSGLQQKDPPLYQVIAALIRTNKELITEINNINTSIINNITNISQINNITVMGFDNDSGNDDFPWFSH